MRDDWIELPEFHGNEFQVGDLVICYDLILFKEGKAKGKVVMIQGDTVTYRTGKSIHIAHYKNCRKLIQNRLKRFWIKKGDAFSYGRGVLITDPEDPANWIQVKEE